MTPAQRQEYSAKLHRDGFKPGSVAWSIAQRQQNGDYTADVIPGTSEQITFSGLGGTNSATDLFIVVKPSS
jgi:hypothetical protein